MGLLQITPPATEPVTLAQARAHLRLDDVTDNALVYALIVAARQHAEGYTHRALITQEWSLVLDEFPRERREFRLPNPALLSVGDITYVDGTGGDAVLDPSLYIVDTASITGRVALVEGAGWPSARRQANAVTVPFSCGFGPAASDVPAAIGQAMLLLIGHWYENREAVNVGNITTSLPFTVEALLAPWRVVEF